MIPREGDRFNSLAMASSDTPRRTFYTIFRASRSLLSLHTSLVSSAVINVRIYIMSLYCRVFVYRYLKRRYHGYLYFFAIYLRDNINRYSL